VSYTLIICEKPSAAKSIAEALADSKPEKNQYKDTKAVWYEFQRDGKDYVTAPAVGHLFTLKQTGKGWDYPRFDVSWVPSFEAVRTAAFSEPYYRSMENLAKDAKDIIVATDYDDEGEVIAYNILRFLFGKKDASRLKFSTMTKEELLESYNHMKKLDKNLVESGLARHYLDYAWGINLTRALTNAIKNHAKRFRILSTGRVQGPVLHILTKHEKKIKAFKSKPFWQLFLKVSVGKQTLNAEYIKDKIWDKKEAEKLLKKIKVKNAVVRSVKKKVMKQLPPKPYNTTAFLADVYRYFGYSPQQALNIAESLYQSGLISYPRTSSQQLPPDINYKKIITSLSKQESYRKDSQYLLGKKELKPTQGKIGSYAHPAIYPTGQLPKRIGDKQKKVYDLVVRRFLACFGNPAERESLKITLDAKGVLFSLNGKKTLKPGWTALYGKYSQREEVLLPDIKEGDLLKVKKSEKIEKKTSPPARFSQGSVLKEMESHSLGTQATRAQILQILYNRGYLIGRSIEVTELGIKLSDVLEKNVSEVVSEKLTKRFEDLTNAIEEGKETRENVMEEAEKELIKISREFKKKEKKIGKDLTEAVIATQDKQSILGTCNKCSGTLKVHKMWRTGSRFVGCTGYKKGCRVGFPLPREGIITSTEKICESCKTPTIQVRPTGRRPFRMCLDPLCETKKDWLDKKKLKEVQEKSRRASRLAKKGKV
jgi:DNA topoisomerase I